MAARKGLGVLGFSVGAVDELAPVLDAYKAEIVNAEPIGAFVNDNIMVTTAATVAEDVEDAIRSISTQRMTYLQSNVFRYHDTFPHPPEIPKWPDLIPDVTEEGARQMIGAPGSVNGTPDDALKGAMAWEAAGADQLVFGFGPPTLEDSLETIRLLGEHVIPKLDKDPVHRTDRFKEAAAAAAS
jgi:alkanesulfonate monooxygenase SsuD/methylene tetrahydromethanopterin reductase-like flavin-dependent oxidoreductase (luciferase family)